MARPAKCRRICQEPRIDRFVPENEIDTAVVENIQLTLDEYETIRLLDYIGMTQEECAKQMDVSRTTVTAIYDSARKKLADAIVNGKRLIMSGGNYQCCDGSSKFCTEERKNSSACRKKACQSVPMEETQERMKETMRIAVTYEPNGQIFQHFGHTEMFKVYEVENQEIISAEVIGTNGSGHGALATLLSQYHIDVLVCGVSAAVHRRHWQKLASNCLAVYPEMQTQQ